MHSFTRIFCPMKSRFYLIALFGCLTLAQAPQVTAQVDDSATRTATLLKLAAETDNPSTRVAILRGVAAGLKGRTGLKAPELWADWQKQFSSSKDPEVHGLARAIGAAFGSADAMAEYREALANPQANAENRVLAIRALAEARDAASLAVFQKMASESGTLRIHVIRALGLYPGAAPLSALQASFGAMKAEERSEVLGVFAARKEGASIVADMLEKGSLKKDEVSTPLIRQLRTWSDATVQKTFDKHFGTALAGGSPERQAEVEKARVWLTADVVASGDRARGRALFMQSCAVCHRLFGEGGELGPELTGANRADVEYLLQNILDPNALIGDDYRTHTVTLKDGRVLQGMVRAQDADTMTLKTLAESVLLPRSTIVKDEVSNVSMMPEGLLNGMHPLHMRDLFAYLAGNEQVAPLITAVTASMVFNGTNLSGWDQRGAWSVKGGVIEGRSVQVPSSLISQMVAEDYTLKCQIRVTGEKAVAELAFRGDEPPGKFTGASLSFGAQGPPQAWLYMGTPPQPLPVDFGSPTADGWWAVEIESRGANVKITIGGKPALHFARFPLPPQTRLGFFVGGQDATLQVRGLVVQP